MEEKKITELNEEELDTVSGGRDHLSTAELDEMRRRAKLDASVYYQRNTKTGRYDVFDRGRLLCSVPSEEEAKELVEATKKLMSYLNS